MRSQLNVLKISVDVLGTTRKVSVRSAGKTFCSPAMTAIRMPPSTVSFIRQEFNAICRAMSPAAKTISTMIGHIDPNHMRSR
eukprot:218380-Prymnesium_polylepis.1